MSSRKVKTYHDSKLIKKTVNIEDKIPRIQNLAELSDYKSELSRISYLSIYQSLKEVEIWNDCSWEQRSILAPIIDFYYDELNRPVIIYPYFEPLGSESEIYRFEEEDAIKELHQRLLLKGMEDEEIGEFIQKVLNLCEDFDLVEEDIITNLNNIGWSDIFGVRIIDFGLDNTIIEEYLKK